MNIIDSSGWLEYFSDTVNAKNFADFIEDIPNLIVPTIILYEVFKKILLEKDETTALKIIGNMRQGKVVDLNTDIALLAASLGRDYHLPMADSIILATARAYNATIFTQDGDFKDIEGVNYFTKL